MGVKRLHELFCYILMGPFFLKFGDVLGNRIIGTYLY